MDGRSQKGSPIFRPSTSFEREFHAESNAVPQMFQFGLTNELEAFLCDVRGDVRSSDESHMPHGRKRHKEMFWKSVWKPKASQHKLQGVQAPAPILFFFVRSSSLRPRFAKTPERALSGFDWKILASLTAAGQVRGVSNGR